jgi:hypothetical protein
MQQVTQAVQQSEEMAAAAGLQHETHVELAPPSESTLEIKDDPQTPEDVNA